MNHSIIICTKDRSEILKKTLRAYLEFDYKGEIIIGDDSNDKEFNNLHKEVLNLEGKLKIHHFRGPKMEHSSRIIRYVNTQVKLFKLLNTDYFTSKGDDDFSFPKFLKKGIKFLDSNPEFSCYLAPEMKVFFNQDWSLTRSFVKNWHEDLNGDPLERCINFSKTANLPWAGVCRSEALKKILKISETTKRDIFVKSKDKSFAHFDPEIPWCLAILANGKVFYDPSIISSIRGEFDGVDRITSQGTTNSDPVSLAGTIYELQQEDSYLALRELHEDLYNTIKLNNSKYDDDLLKKDVWVIISKLLFKYQGRFLCETVKSEMALSKSYLYIIYKKLKKISTDYLTRDKFNLKKSKDYLNFINFVKKDQT